MVDEDVYVVFEGYLENLRSMCETTLPRVRLSPIGSVALQTMRSQRLEFDVMVIIQSECITKFNELLEGCRNEVLILISY